MSADVIPLHDHLALEPDDGEEWSDPEIYAGADAKPLIDEGLYEARVHCVKSFDHYFKNRKPVPARLILTFTILSGPQRGTRLPMYLLLPKDHKKTHQRHVGAASRFYRAWTVANGCPPKRRDRMSTAVFRNRLFSVRVRNVDTDRHQEDLPRITKHSVVDMIMERLA